MKLLCRITFLYLFIALGYSWSVSAQEDNSTFLLHEKLKGFEKQQGYLQDTAYANTLIGLAYIYAYSYPDSALALLEGFAENCRANGYWKGEVDTYIIKGDAFQTKGNYEKALECYEKSYLLSKNKSLTKGLPLILNRVGMIQLNQGNYTGAINKFYESLKAAEAIGNKVLMGATLNNIAVTHFHQGKFAEAGIYYQKRLKIAEDMLDTSSMSIAFNGLGQVYLKQKNIAKAQEYLGIAYNLASKINDQEMLLTTTLSLAETNYASGSLPKAAVLFENALNISKKKDNGENICNALIGLAKVQQKQGLLNEGLANALEGLQRAETMGQVQIIRDASEIVSTIYEERGEGINALKYYKIYKKSSDSLNNLASQRAAAIEKAGYEFSKKENAFQRKTAQQQWIIFSAFAALVFLSVLVWIINRNKRRLNSTYKDLQQKNLELHAQKLKAEEALRQLKAAQSLLIQSEKMASLGELTAGIAHEIQNPLNFVNNFSEVNGELIGELEDEVDKGNGEEIKAIAGEIKQNLEKIYHHGKRADAIVKGMLQHSRTSTGKKEITDVNKLADEYLRLSYHGLKARDKNFNASFHMEPDPLLKKINIIPEEIGRVILNLVSNAFYAIGEKKKAQPAGYDPRVIVSTKNAGNNIIISVADNGTGIPDQVKEKIFQPFFTTKPTGQGTGLGLSLSYDIVKAHGGEIKVESKEGEGCEFILLLPTN